MALKQIGLIFLWIFAFDTAQAQNFKQARAQAIKKVANEFVLQYVDENPDSIPTIKKWKILDENATFTSGMIRYLCEATGPGSTKEQLENMINAQVNRSPFVLKSVQTFIISVSSAEIEASVRSNDYSQNPLREGHKKAETKVIELSANRSFQREVVLVVDSLPFESMRACHDMAAEKNEEISKRNEFLGAQ